MSANTASTTTTSRIAKVAGAGRASSPAAAATAKNTRARARRVASNGQAGSPDSRIEVNRAAGNLAAERDLLLAVLRGALSGGWQGPTLTSAVRGLTPELAAASVSGRKSIWQQLLHVAFWKRRVLNMLVPDRTPFPRRGANWPSLPERIDADTWLADLALLEGLNERLLRAVSELPASRYSPKVRQAIFGIAAHDIYHAGQMNLIRRLLGERTSPQSRQKPQGKPKPNREPKATTRKRTT